MNRLIPIAVVAVALVSLLAAQERQVGTLPPGPPPGPTDNTWLVNALFVQASMVEGGQVMFVAPAEEPDPNKVPLPAIVVQVDGKAVRAFDVDRKPLDIPELNKRLSERAAAVVVRGQAPDPFFLKALQERTVIFVVPGKLFDHMAKPAAIESIGGWWTVMTPDGKAPAPADNHWIVEGTKIAVHRDGKLERYMTYKISADEYPRTIDLTPDRGPAKGKTLKGIYDRDGNRLTICHVSPDTEEPEKAQRPKEIGAKGTVTVVLAYLVP